MRNLTITLGANDQLQLFIPGTDAEGHHVNIPITVDGLRIIRKILRERARQPKPRIGMDSAPTQAQVNAWLRAEAERRLEAQRALGVEAEKLLEELGAMIALEENTTVLYHVTFAPERLSHIGPQERFVATVRAVEDNKAIWAYHLVHGKYLVPDYAAIREALPHQHRKAYDRAGRWWFPITPHSELSGLPDQRNACSRTLRDAKGRLLGTLYATPYLYDSPSIGRACVN